MDKQKVIELSGAAIWQRENKILSDVSLDINAGEFVYIIGKVGAGKTSLIKTLNAELPLVSGDARVAGYQLKNIKTKEISGLRKKLGVVFQDFRLLADRNVYENLAFVLKATGWKSKSEIEKRIVEVLDWTGVTDKMKKMPHQLSGGEQQKVVITRAILNDPLILLADEPTGNLDPETSAEILDLFFRLNSEGKTVLMVTRDYAAISGKPARTIVCSNGRISDSMINKEMTGFENLLAKNV
jgi:cell division transport system ATP-binding protein